MNFVFDIAQGAIAIALIWLVYFLFFRTHVSKNWVKVAAWVFTCWIVIYTLFYGTMNSLPKNQVRHAYVPPAPQAVEIKPTEDFIDHKDRLGQFDKKLEDEKPQ